MKTANFSLSMLCKRKPKMFAFIYTFNRENSKKCEKKAVAVVKWIYLSKSSVDPLFAPSTRIYRSKNWVSREKRSAGCVNR